jgi:predicted acetyltransferase
MIKKLSSWQEIMESDRVISTAFLDNWNEEKSRQQSKKKEEAPDPDEERWGLYDERGNMVTSFIAGPTRLSYDGQIIDCGEGHMIGSLPEARSHGNVRKLLHYVMEEFDQGDMSSANLFPFPSPFTVSSVLSWSQEICPRNSVSIS